MWVRALLGGAMLAGLLGACAMVDPVDNRYDTVGRSLAKARDEAIFLNLIRASNDYPLAFTTIANVTPTMTNTSSFGLPAFLLGPLAHLSTTTGTVQSLPSNIGRDVVFGNTTASNVTAVGSNFSIATQETGSFYNGFLKPIDLQTLDYFIRQGYPREMLFWLFTDSFELTARQGVLGFHYNPPQDLGCDPHDPKHRCFVDWVHNATLSGLTVEEKALEKQGGAKTTTLTFARFCFNPVLAEQANERAPEWLKAQAQKDLDVNRTKLFKGQLACASQSWEPEKTIGKTQPDVLPLVFDNGAFTFRIIPRSAYGVFEFLGNLMKLGREHYVPNQSLYPAMRQWAAGPPTLLTEGDVPLMQVVEGGNNGACFVHTSFNGSEYCVPEQATITKRVFGLLAQLIAIQTAVTDLSITPVVRVIQ